MTIRAALISLICTLLLPLTCLAETAEPRFIDAKKALQRGNWTEFFALKEQLANHPLHPYLDYYYININFKTVDDNVIQQYINKHPQSPMANKLRRKWLTELAEDGQWQQFLNLFQPTKHRTINCYYLTALQQTGKGQQAHDQIKAMWLTGKNQPDNCDIVFNTWLQQSNDKNNLLWQRFELALKSYNFKLAKSLILKMSPQKSLDANEVLKVYKNPYLVSKNSYLNTQPSAEVISYGIYRVARRSPSAAINLWQRLSKRYDFNKKQKQRIFQAIAIKFAMRKNINSTKWFRKLVGNKLDPVYKEWMIRSAIYHGDWKLVKDSIEALPKDDKTSSRWQYWHARSLAKLGNHKQAEKIFLSLSEVRSYHGFLAALYLKKEIDVKHHVPQITDIEIAEVKQLPGMQRAKLLYQLNQHGDARLELYYLMKHANQKQQYIINKLVSKWGWHSQALRLSRHAHHKDDLILRFPLLYHDVVLHHAKLRNLNPALIYAIIRQESYFTANIVSHAGAIGLMQLMPQTAYVTSKQFKLKYSGTSDLRIGKTNIQLGSAHLRKLHQQLKNHPILVIAAYNASRRAVNRWLPKNKHVPADIWIETIPFHETRNYIKNVIACYLVYQYRLGQAPSMKDIMRSIK